MLTVGEIFLGKAVDLDYQGQGIVKHQGCVVFVTGMLVQEEAKIKITKLKKHFGQGEIVELLKPSPYRVDNSSHILGSCDLIHLSPSQQLLWQHRITRETLKKIMDIDFEVHATVTDGIEEHYRNKCVFHVIDGPYLSLGLYHRTSKKLVPIEQFILADEKTNEVIQNLFLNPVLINPRVFKYMVFRTNKKQEILITLVATKELFLGRDILVEQLKKIPNVTGITLNINADRNRILGDVSIVLYGENLITERLRDIEVMISDQSFFQINPPIAEKAYHLIEQEIKADDTIVDAYSGIGSIGFYLAKKAKKIIMIESSESSAQMATLIKEKYQYEHIEIFNEKAETVIHLFDADHLIVDPPRNGLMPEFINEVLKHEYKKIFYLSCDVKTLARDLNLLTKRYEIKDIYPLRMFYHTTSLETLVILTKKTEAVL